MVETRLESFLWVIQDSRLHRVTTSGEWKAVKPPEVAEWGGKTAIAALNRSLFVLQNSRLHRVDPSSGEWTQLGSPDWAWNEGEALFLAGAGGSLYAIQNSHFHRVVPETGDWEPLGEPEWNSVTAMAATENAAWVSRADGLYSINTSPGNLGKATHRYPQRDALLSSAQAMTAVGNMLYLVSRDGRLVHIDPAAAGPVKVLGSFTFAATSALASIEQRLFVVSEGELLRIDLVALAQDENLQPRRLSVQRRTDPISMTALAIRVPKFPGPDIFFPIS